MSRIALLGIGAVVLLTLGYWLLGYRPVAADRALVAEETVALAGQRQQLEAEVARLEGIRADEERLRADLVELDALVPADPAQAAALVQLQGVADRTGAEVRSITFADPVAVEPVQPAGDGMQLGTIATTMVLEGPYPEAVAAIRAVEEDVDRAALIGTVSVAEGEDGFPSLATTVTVSLFARLPAEVPVAAATPVPTPGPAQ